MTHPIVEECRELIELLPSQALARARQKRPGIGAIAVFPVYAPYEIIHAAGLLPLGMFGAGGKIETMHADSRFQSFICSIAKSTLELFLNGELKDFEGAVFSSICDVARNLASVAGRNAPDMYIEYLHLPQNSVSEPARVYTRNEFARFRANLGERVGRPITDDALRESIAIYNRVRRLMRELYDCRRNNSGLITTGELFTVVQAGTLMMPEDFEPMLVRLLEDVRKRKPVVRDTVAVVLEGSFCEAPPIELIETIEQAGCQIMDDDLAVGWRLFTHDVPVEGNPADNLADAYLGGSMYTSVRHDNGRPRTEGLLKRMDDAGASAVVCAAAKFCEPALLDYVLFRQTLDERDIPHLKLEFEEKMWTFDRLRNEVETFTESLLFD